MEDRLYKFARLVDAGSFTEAAKRLHISQPALTTAIKKLERELHAELLVRSHRTLKLTAAGAIAYETAKSLHTQSQNLKAALAEITNQPLTLRVGLIDGIADLLFVHGDSLGNLEQEATVSLSVDNTAQLLTFVRRDDLDIALIAQPQTLPAGLETIALGEEPLLLVVKTSDLQKTTKDIQQHKQIRMLSYNQTSRTYYLIEQYLLENSIQTTPTFYSTSPELILQLARAGRGIAALPFLLVQPHIASGELAILRAGGTNYIPRSIVAVHRSGRSVATPVLALLDAARNQLTRLMTTTIAAIDQD